MRKAKPHNQFTVLPAALVLIGTGNIHSGVSIAPSPIPLLTTCFAMTNFTTCC